MIINHNIAALVTNNALSKADANATKASKRLSTGYKINTAADDAAGLAISNKMRAQIKSLEMADRNTNDAISLVQTAEGGLSEVQNMLQRMRELAVEGATDTVSDSDREKIQVEIDQLIEEVQETSNKILFNNKPLFSAEAAAKSPYVFQVGQNKGLTLELDIVQIDAVTLGIQDITDSQSCLTREGCSKAIDTFDDAVQSISKFRATLGAFQNRLDYTSSSLLVSDENAQQSLSRIRDTDMASEMSEYAKYNVITQAGIAMLSQANQRPNQLLSLLQ